MHHIALAGMALADIALADIALANIALAANYTHIILLQTGG